MLYGMLYVVLWIAFGAAVYFGAKLVVPHAPSVPPCTSGCIPTSTAPLATSTVWTFVTAPQHYTFLAQIVNTDPDYAATYFNYDIELRDASGTIMRSIPGASFVYQGQRKYLVVPNVTITHQFVSADLFVKNAYWQASSSLGEVPHFASENVRAAQHSSTVSVGGQLTNSNIASTRYVFVDAIFLGPNGGPIGASKTELNNVGPQQTVNFSVLYPQTGAINPAAYKLFVYGLK